MLVVDDSGSKERIRPALKVCAFAKLNIVGTGKINNIVTLGTLTCLNEKQFVGFHEGADEKPQLVGFHADQPVYFTSLQRLCQVSDT